MRSPKIEADIFLVSQGKTAKIPSDSFLADGPGEYDVKEVCIQGFSAEMKAEKGENPEETTIYTIEAEEMRICHLGLLGQKELDSSCLEKIGDVDILMIPVGGGRAIDGAEAVKVMSQIEPKIVIPMYYKIPKLKPKLDGLDKFLKAAGIKKPETLSKLSVKKKNLSPEMAKIIVLES